MKKRFNFRVKLHDWTFFAMIAKTQTLEGVTSLQPCGRHIIMFDSKDKCILEKLIKKFREIQQKYSLSDIFIVSDKEGSYRVWCFTTVGFVTLLQIMLDAHEFIDWNFFYWTVVRCKATLRIADKRDRLPQQIVCVLNSYPIAIPKTWERVIYDTGIEKSGKNIFFGR